MAQLIFLESLSCSLDYRQDFQNGVILNAGYQAVLEKERARRRSYRLRLAAEAIT
jgi:hypothetical protein